MTFLSTLQQGEAFSLKFYATIDGLPYVLANFPCPTAWDTGGGVVSIDGEDYTWVEDGLRGRDIGQAGVEFDPRTGQLVSSVSNLEFRIPDDESNPALSPWFDYLARGLQRSDVSIASLAQPLAVADTTATLTTVTGWPSSGLAYIGLETVRYTGTGGGSGNDLTGLTRGAYRSPVLSHGSLEIDAYVIDTGAYVRTSPLRWQGRVVRLWLCAGDGDASGAFVPNGASIESTEDFEWTRGIVVGRDIIDGTLILRTDLAGLEQLLAEKILTRQPRARATTSPAPGVFMVQVDPASWAVNFEHEGGGHGRTVVANDNRLYAGAGFPVSEGLYSLTDIAAALKYTFNSKILPEVTGVQIIPTLTDDGEPRLRIIVRLTTTSSLTSYFGLGVNGGLPGNIWRQIGFTSDQWHEDSTSAGVDKTHVFNTDQAPPLFYMPEASAGLRTRIYYQPAPDSIPAFDPTPGWKDANGVEVDGYVRVEEEIFRFTADTAGPGGLRYLTIAARGQLRSYASKEIYVEDLSLSTGSEQEETPEVVQGFVIPNAFLTDALAYAIHSGSGVDGTNHSTHDRAWKGSGGNIHGDHVATSTFITSAFASRMRWDAVWAFEPMALRDLVKGELVLEQLALGASNENDGDGFRIRIVDMRDLMLHEQAGAQAVNDDDDIDDSGIEDVDDDSEAVNRVNVTTLWDAGADKPQAEKVPIISATWSEAFGPSSSIDLKVRALINAAGAQERLIGRVQRVFAQWGRPPHIVEIPFATFESWLWNPGKALSVTSSEIIDREEVGRGVTSRLVRVLKRDSVAGAVGEATSSRITCKVDRGMRFVAITPGAYCESVVSGSQYAVTAQRFRSADTGLKDIEDFDVGMYVRCYEPGDEGGAVEREITAIDIPNSRVTLASATGFVPFVIEYPQHDSANISAEQLRYASIASGTPPVLNLDGGGTEDPHRYQ